MSTERTAHAERIDPAPPRVPQRDTGADPLWSQAADAVLDLIDSRGLASGAKLPPERELCARLDVSRVTLRKALNSLVDRGVLTASHGRGWFVATRPTAREWPNDLESFSATARSKHMTARSLVLRQDQRAATLDEAERLDIPAGTPLFRLERVRLLNEVRIAVDRCLLPLATAPRLAGVDFTSASLFAELRADGVELDRSVVTIESRSADEVLAAHLEIPVGGPILALDQLVYTREQVPAMLSTVEYAGERYRLRTTFRQR
ncbi:GntR family transcriptional regulator [Catenulispora yoronensis]|uniref:GntR family transcriptional regulator n=1 Tax=Catenulispora yoronensis TaxID=450799 RepID=A0ABN2U1K6_9ACTN